MRQVGLALAVDKDYGIPFYYRAYRENAHDSKVFAEIIDELIEKIKLTFNGVDDLVLILDKGNNSKENFKQLKDKIKWVGSLAPSQYAELAFKDVADYMGKYLNILFHATFKKIMDMDCLVVSTYRASLARKQAYTLQSGLAKLTSEIQNKWNAYKKRPTKVPVGFEAMLKDSRHGKFLSLEVQSEQLLYAIVDKEREKAQQRFGRNLLFTDNVRADAAWVIANYQSKNKIEESFKLIKGTDLIRFRPIRHFTDTKICAFTFCCVVALMLIKVLELRCTEAELKVSHELIKEELSDIKAVTMIYSPKDVVMETTRRSSIQQRLWDLFRLEEIANQLPYKS